MARPIAAVARGGQTHSAELTVGPGWNFAVPDWVERLKSGTSLMPVLPLNDNEAARAAAIFNRFRLPDVIGQPRLEEAAGEWVREVVRAIFGSLMSGNRRMVQDTFLLVPKKNSKSTTSAAIMLLALIMNQRPNALFGIFGPTQEIADIAFQAATDMVQADPEITKLFHVQEHLKLITYRLTGATLKVTTFDVKVATGGKYAGWLLDEAHLLGNVSYAERVVEQLRGARVAIPEQFGVIITTQSDVPPAGFFLKELTYARAVRDGLIPDAKYLAVLYEFPVKMQADKSEPWKKAEFWSWVNPNMGRSASIEAIQDRYREAAQKGATNLQTWASQYLNIQIGIALQNDRWSGADYWLLSSEPSLSFKDLLERCECIVVGGDGGGLDDLFGFAAIGRERITGRWLHWGRVWADRSILELRPEIAARLLDFDAAGELKLFDLAEDGNVDIKEFADLVMQIYEAGLLPEKNGVGLDPVGVAALVDEMVERGVPHETITGVPQGYRLSGNIKGAARKLKDGTLRHAGQAVMAWSVGNARRELRGSAEMITKQVSGSAKIDPLMALFNAFDLMSRNPQAAASQVFTSQSVVVV